MTELGGAGLAVLASAALSTSMLSAIVGMAGGMTLLALMLLSLDPLVVLGTWVGSRLLHRVSEIGFTRLYRTVLSLIALRLLVPD